LVLVGYRGTGKTTVGRMLAERLGWEFADADHEAEAHAGRPIATIFAEQGEEAFRDLEARVIADLTSRPRLVLATGGGAVLREANRAALRSVGFVAWLTADPETLAHRLGRDRARLAARPPLTAAGTLDEIADVLAARSVHYRAVSDLEVETAHRSCRQVADAVLRAFQGSGAGGAK
jgi:shikimate kinase